jgi:hypothetical protein
MKRSPAPQKRVNFAIETFGKRFDNLEPVPDRCLSEPSRFLLLVPGGCLVQAVEMATPPSASTRRRAWKQQSSLLGR